MYKTDDKLFPASSLVVSQNPMCDSATRNQSVYRNKEEFNVPLKVKKVGNTLITQKRDKIFLARAQDHSA